jgi:uncharacterized protein YbjT (DUF2867 family)
MSDTSALTVLIFGATGSAGGSVLRACLGDRHVAGVRTIARRAPAIAGPKLRAYIHDNFLDYTAVADAFAGVDACFFCLGVSSVQVSDEKEYTRITHDFAIAAAEMLAARSPGAAFHYISGTGTKEDSRLMWARVKGRTERELMERFNAVCWRPAAIDGEPSSTVPWYHKFLRPVFWVLRPFRSMYIAGSDLGRAMVRATREGMRARVLENSEMRDVADRADAPVER